MRRGSSHVKGLYDWPDDGRQTYNGAQAIRDTGMQVLKMYLTPDYATDYPEQDEWTFEGEPVTPPEVAELAQTDQMTHQMDMDWAAVVLTVFTFANGATNWWRVDPSAEKMWAEYDEIKRLAAHLLATYDGTGKTFVVQNWEGDWAFMDSFEPNTPVPEYMTARYAAFLGTRQRAIADARAQSTSDCKSYHAVEVNRAVDARLYPHRRRILTDLAARIQPDVVSYSAYDGTIVDQGGWGSSHADWAAATEPVFRKALRTIKAAFPRALIQIGEFGFPEGNEKPETADIAGMIRLVDTVAEEEGCIFNLYWQVFDNEPGGSDWGPYRGYWLVRPDGTLSEAGVTMSALVAEKEA